MKTTAFRCVIWMAAGLMLLLSMGCGKPEPIRIGFVAGLSGRVADLGVAGRNGAMLAMEQINQAGGLKGRKVELVVRDDQQNDEIARNAVSELLSLDLEVIIGPMTSSMAMAVLPLVNASPSILVSPTSTTTDLEKKDDHFLRVINSTRAYAAKAAHYQNKKRGRRRAAAIYDLGNKAYTESWLRDFTRTFEDMGGKIIDRHGFTSGNRTAFYKAIQNLLASEPDLILIIANAVDAALICQQLRKVDRKIPIVMSEWASTERFIQLGGQATEGIHVAQFLDRDDDSEKYQRFRQAYLERFGQEPGFAGVAGYDAASVVLAALDRRTPGQTLKRAIIAIGKFPCLQQTIAIDRFGDADRRVFITMIREGKFHKIE